VRDWDFDVSVFPAGWLLADTYMGVVVVGVYMFAEGPAADRVGKSDADVSTTYHGCCGDI
jgi:hypothetical protein